jgi:hypothetical protein
MNLGINFFSILGSLCTCWLFHLNELVQAHTSLYKSKKVIGRFPDVQIRTNKTYALPRETHLVVLLYILSKYNSFISFHRIFRRFLTVREKPGPDLWIFYPVSLKNPPSPCLLMLNSLSLRPSSSVYLPRFFSAITS